MLQHQYLSARTLSIDILDDGSRFRLIIFFRQFLVAELTNAKIALTVVVDPSVTDSSADPTDITEIVKGSDPLESKFMAYRASLFRTGRNTTRHAIECLAYSAKRTTNFLLPTFMTLCFYHLFVGTNEKLQNMIMETFVL